MKKQKNLKTNTMVTQKIVALCLILGLTFTGLACSGKDKPNGGDEVAAKKFLAKFFIPNADYRALTKLLTPTLEDCKAYFNAGIAEDAYNYYSALFSDPDAKIMPKKEQTELLLFSATVKDLANQTEAAMMFPGGYRKAVSRIKPGFTVYKFKFVRSGKQYGRSFDGLVYVNGHWKLFPKPWRFIK